MLRVRKYYLWLVLAVASCQALFAQDTAHVAVVPANSENITPADTTPSGGNFFTVRTIIIEGNKKTRPSIILRELPFKPGDAYLLPDLVKKFEVGRKRLMNTALFHEAIVALKSSDGYNIDVLVHVKERWYVFPIPYFKPVDRNLNQWIVEQKASLSRVNYGIKLMYNNVTGRNDRLRLLAINGYTKQLSFNYEGLYFDKRMRWGFSTGFNMGKNREINYSSVNDKQVFFRDSDNYLHNFASAYAELTYRRAIRTRHRFGIGFTTENVADTVVKLNPSYFQSGRKQISYPQFYYTMTYYDLDYIPYPTKGYAAEITIDKRGINKAVNLWQFSVKASGNWTTGKRSFFSLNSYAAIKLPYRQPYSSQRLLGYSDVFLQGYEYYVIDGSAGGYLKAAFTRKLFDFGIRVPGTKKFAPFRFPINVYGKIYGNAGYIYNPTPGNNFLSNKMLYSSGLGIDITTIYDFNIKLEWSFNQLGQNGLFLHRRTIF